MQSSKTGLLVVLTTLSLSGIASAQITGDLIASNISADTGRPQAAYATYSENLAVTLSGLSAEALERVLGTAATVEVQPVLLNDALGLEPINFGFMSSSLPAAAKAELDKVLEYLTENPEATIMIAGHTSLDYSGAVALSEARANAAKLYLVEHGIDAGQIETAGYGNSQPLADATSNSDNQRIEISLTN